MSRHRGEQRTYPQGVKTLESLIEEDSWASSFFRHQVKPTIARLHSLRPYSIERTIFMTGMPRGGTTWLSEILATIPRSSVIWEPFDLAFTRELVELGFDWRMHIPPDADRPEVTQFMKKLLTGRVRNARINNSSSLRQILSSDTLVVKALRGQMLLHWMSNTLDFRKPGIFVLRHPCAVVSSQLHWGYWKNMEVPRFPATLEEYPEFDAILDTVHTLEEKLAAVWAMEVRTGLGGAKPLPFLIVTYEGMVERGEEEVQRIFDALRLDVPDRALGQLRKPSGTTVSDSHVAQRKNPLEGWVGKLSRRQVREILRVVHDFGIEFYDEATLPDEAAIQALSAY